MSATTQAASDVAPAKHRLIDPANGRLWHAALALLLAGTAFLMLYMTRGLTFNLDEWTVITQRRGPGAPSLLEPHNEHLTLLFFAVFLPLLKLGGLDAFALMMLPLAALQVGLGALLFVITQRRLGAGVAVGVAAFALLSGLAYENFLIPGQAAQMFSIVAGVGAFALLDKPRTPRTDWGLAALLVVILVVVAYRAFRVGAAGRIRLAALAVILLTFYGLTAVSRHDIAPPSSSRYLTVGIVFLLLMLVEAARGWKIRIWVPFVVLLLVWISFGKADGNADALRDGRILFLQRSEHVRASLGAVELLGRDRVAPTFEIAPLAAPFLEAGPWFDTLAGLRGNPGYSASQLVRAPADARVFADDTLIRAGGLAMAPGGVVSATRRARCVALRGSIVPPAGVRVEAGATRERTVRARRFGTEWKLVGVFPVPAGRAIELRPLKDASPVPYEIRTQGPGRTCRLGA